MHSLFDESVGHGAKRYRAALAAAERGEASAEQDQRTALRAARRAFDKLKG